MSATEAHCNECGEWFDARYSHCPNGHERSEQNAALKHSVEKSRFDAALGNQMRMVQGEAAATRMVPQGAKGAGPTSLYPASGARQIVEHIKRDLRESGAFE